MRILAILTVNQLLLTVFSGFRESSQIHAQWLVFVVFGSSRKPDIVTFLMFAFVELAELVQNQFLCLLLS